MLLALFRKFWRVINMRLMEGKEDTRHDSHQGLYPRKMIVKQGTRNVLLDTTDIIYCYSNNKVVFIVSTDNQKYIADKNLLHFEAELDPNVFFRANRTQIINFNFIRSFVTHERNKIKVELKMTEKKNEEVLLSQTRVIAFRQWIQRQL